METYLATTGSPRLTTGCFAIIPLQTLEKVLCDLDSKLKCLPSHDCILGAQQLACIYSHIIIMTFLPETGVYFLFEEKKQPPHNEQWICLTTIAFT